MQLFYQPQLTAESTSVGFDKEESRHITRVLRKDSGDVIHITNGNGLLFTAELGLVGPKHCEAYLTKVEKKPTLPYSLHLAVAPTKSNDRFEWLLEKATEIGVSEITPLLCKRSERKQINWERYNKILVSAMKQSLKTYLPQLNPLTSFEAFLDGQKEKEGIKTIAHCDDGQKQALKEVIDQSENTREYLVCIGPEGDFDPEEIQNALDNGLIPISLGEQRLRTETAAIAACHSFALLKG